MRENGVIELQIIDGGDSYKITDPTMPIMALIAVPTGTDPWNPTNLWPGMQPYPENFTDADTPGNTVYTFLNICFVNVKSVGAGGEILELEINSPGDNYPPGSTVYIVDGTGENVSTYDAQAAPSAQWIPGPGRGARARVVSSGQFIGIAGGEQYPLNGVPRMGDLLYMVTYGWGMDDSEKHCTIALQILACFYQIIQEFWVINFYWKHPIYLENFKIAWTKNLHIQRQELERYYIL